MDKSERMELRKRRLERLGRWDSAPKPEVKIAPRVVEARSSSVAPNPQKRCGCSRSKG